MLSLATFIMSHNGSKNRSLAKYYLERAMIIFTAPIARTLHARSNRAIDRRGESRNATCTHARRLLIQKDDFCDFNQIGLPPNQSLRRSGSLRIPPMNSPSGDRICQFREAIGFAVGSDRKLKTYRFRALILAEIGFNNSECRKDLLSDPIGYSNPIGSESTSERRYNFKYGDRYNWKTTHI